ncbi:hypothetical protein FA95DRAFT_1607978 [Auriscalpium vulgare]|uniref:Uncharacterized protein n=1 Tax=Auriscalpium vulgare TaxID=40419 RepID=A0ACB8RN37_9AGAM|nr:hypothetical protein FA95DRAFT_1607978 [Auriscalpium vulgare]
MQHQYQANYQQPIDYTRMLNNVLQQRHQAHLLSWDCQPSGPEHQLTYTAYAYINGQFLGSGQGNTKGQAKNAASYYVLTNLGAV